MAEKNTSINILVNLIDNVTERSNNIQRALNGLENKRKAAERAEQRGEKERAARLKKEYADRKAELEKALEAENKTKFSLLRQFSVEKGKIEASDRRLAEAESKKRIDIAKDEASTKNKIAVETAKQEGEESKRTTIGYRAESKIRTDQSSVEAARKKEDARTAGKAAREEETRTTANVVSSAKIRTAARRAEIDINKQASLSSIRNDEREENRRRIRQENELIRLEKERRLELDRTGTFLGRLRYQTELLNDRSRRLTVTLSRVGLAVRGVVVAGALIFSRALLSIFGALAGQAIALVGSLVSVAGALGGILVAGAAQAIPVLGLLAGAMSRLSAIQEAVNQNDLLQKQQFGDTGDAEAAAGAASAVAQAQEAVKEAQENLTKAREEAKKELRDLILQEKEAELAFKRSGLAQREARAALRERIASGEGSLLELESDMLAVPEARVSRARARNDLTDTRQDLNKAQRGGIGNMDGVRAATKALADANRQLADAQRSATSAMESQSAAASNLQYFLSQLTPTERKVYKAFVGFRDRFKKVMSGVTDILFNTVLGSFDKIEKAVFNPRLIGGFEKLSKQVGRTFNSLVNVVTSERSINFWDRTIGRASKNLEPLEKIIKSIYIIFMNIADAAAPAFEELLNMISDGLGDLEDKSNNKSGLRQFFSDGMTQLKAWLQLIGAIGKLLGGLFSASADSALTTLGDLTARIEGAADYVKKNKKEVKAFFDETAEGFSYLVDILVTVGGALIELFRADSIRTFSIIIDEVFIPALVQAIIFTDQLVDVIQKILDIPFVKEFFKWAIALSITKSAFGLLFSILGSLIGPFRLLANVLLPNLGGAIKDAFLWGRIYLDDFFKAISKAGGIFNVIKNAGGILRIFSKALAGIPVIGWLVVGAIELVIGVFSALKDNFLGITDAMDSALSGLGDAFSNLFSAFSAGGSNNGLGTIKDVLLGILNVIWDIISAIFDVIGFIGKLAATAVLFTVIQTIIKPLTLVINLIAGIVRIWSKFVADVRKDGLGKALKNLASNAGKALGGLIASAIKMLIRLPILIVKGVIAAGKALIPALWKLLKGAAKLVGNIASGIWTLLTNREVVLNALQGVGEALWNFIKNLPKFLLGVLKAAGKGIWDGLVSGIGAGTVEKIVNVIISGINKAIDLINKVNPFDDIEKLDAVDLTPNKSAGPIGPQGKRSERPSNISKDIDKETNSQKRNNKAKQENTKFTGANYKALGLNAEATRKTTRQNRNLADALGKTASAHRKAKALQDSLNKSSQVGFQLQAKYVNSLRQAVKVEDKLADATNRTKRAKGNYAETVRNTSKAQGSFNEKIKNTSKAQALNTAHTILAERNQRRYSGVMKLSSKAQEEYFKGTNAAFRSQKRFNAEVSDGTKNQRAYSAGTAKSTKQIKTQQGGVTDLSRKFGKLNSVLMITGKNSVALGNLFRTVTNKILKEFNVKTLKVKLPSADSVFEKTMGSTQGFASGGYFGDKKLRNKDDRLIAVAGGEAILTGYHQPEVNRALSFANQYGVTKYDSLDSMFSSEKRPHYTAPASNKNIPIGGPKSNKNIDTNYRSSTREKESAGVFPMGYAWRGVSPQGIRDGVRKLAGLMMYKYPFLAASSTTRNDPGSFHDYSSAQAVDLATTPYSRMLDPAAWVGQNYGSSLAEGIFNPNLSIDSGRPVDPSFWTPKTWADHQNHIHIAVLGGDISPGGFPTSGMIEIPKIPKIKVEAPEGSLKDQLQGQSDMLRKAANEFLSDELAFGMAFGGGALSRAEVAKIAKMALEITKLPVDKESIRRLVWLAYQESSFNPNTVNDWDSNAAAGNPSQGLMQTTLTTFDTYKMKKYGDIFNPLHNMIASIRYQMARYGSLVTFSPYASGGMVPEFNDGGVVPGRVGQPVLAKVHAGETILPTHRMTLSSSANKGGSKNPILNNLDTLKDVFKDLSAVLDNKFESKSKKGKEKIKKFVNRLTKFLDLVEKTNDNFENIVKKQSRRLSKWAFKIVKGYASQTKTSDQIANRELNNLESQQVYLENQQKIYDSAIKDIRARLRKTGPKQKDLRKKLRFAINKLIKESGELQDNLIENIQSQIETQAALFEADIAKFDVKRSALDTRIQIQEALGTLSMKEGDTLNPNRADIQRLIEQDTNILKEQRGRIEKELRSATKAGNKDLIDSLKQQLLENQLAIIENSIRIKELNESTQDNTDATEENTGLNFTTTAWEQFRVAVLSGVGINPNLAQSIPKLNTGGFVTREGLAYLHAAEVVTPASRGIMQGTSSGPLVENINFTQPMEVADPVAISNQIGFKLSTLKSI